MKQALNLQRSVRVPWGKSPGKGGQLWDRYGTEDESLDKQQSNRLQQVSGQ